MINRQLIRLKVVQLVYEQRIIGACNDPQDANLAKTCLSADKAMPSAVHALEASLQKSYDLYHHLLMFMVDLHRVAERQVDAAIQRTARLNLSEIPSRRFVEGKFITQLADNEQLKAYCANGLWGWMDHEQYLLKTYNAITQSERYKTYMALEAPTYDDDKQLWHEIYLEQVCNNEFIDSLLEDESLYWNDDKFIIDSFVLKTIMLFRPSRGKEQPLLEKFRSDDDLQFATELLQAAIKGADNYQALIASHLQPGWEIERIARMDSVIMQVALAEMINFDDIPLNVTLNEYIEIAKAYSTPQSGAYVNGMLDAMAKTLHRQGVITKT